MVFLCGWKGGGMYIELHLLQSCVVVSRLVTDSEGRGVPLSGGNAAAGLDGVTIRRFSLGVLPNHTLISN